MYLNPLHLILNTTAHKLLHACSPGLLKPELSRTLKTPKYAQSKSVNIESLSNTIQNSCCFDPHKIKDEHVLRNLLDLVFIFIFLHIYFRVLIFLFIQKNKLADSHRLLLETYVEHTRSIRICETWFRLFKIGDFDVKKSQRSVTTKVRKRAIEGVIG